MPNGEMKKRSSTIADVYKRFMAKLFPLQKRQDAIIEDVVKKGDEAKLADIRRRLGKKS